MIIKFILLPNSMTPFGFFDPMIRKVFKINIIEILANENGLNSHYLVFLNKNGAFFFVFL